MKKLLQTTLLFSLFFSFFPSWTMEKQIVEKNTAGSEKASLLEKRAEIREEKPWYSWCSIGSFGACSVLCISKIATLGLLMGTLIAVEQVDGAASLRNSPIQHENQIQNATALELGESFSLLYEGIVRKGLFG